MCVQHVCRLMLSKLSRSVVWCLMKRIRHASSQYEIFIFFCAVTHIVWVLLPLKNQRRESGASKKKWILMTIYVDSKLSSWNWKSMKSNLLYCKQRCIHLVYIRDSRRERERKRARAHLMFEVRGDDSRPDSIWEFGVWGGWTTPHNLWVRVTQSLCMCSNMCKMRCLWTEYSSLSGWESVKMKI